VAAFAATAATEHSLPEVQLAFQVRHFLPFDLDDHAVHVADRGRPWDVDIVIREPLRIAIEYDGSYYHRKSGKLQLDKRKMDSLTRAGWTVIRVRERPLEKVGPHDVIPDSIEPKIVANAVLNRLQSILGCPLQGLDEYLDRPGLLDEIEATKYWEEHRSIKKWLERYEAMAVFIERSGRSPQFDKPGEPSLYHWLSKQRRQVRDGTIHERKRELLEELPYWTATPDADSWATTLYEVVAWHSEHGCLPRQRANTHCEEHRLGTWLATATLDFKPDNPRIQQLSSEEVERRREMLTDLPGFSWRPRADRFASRIDELDRIVQCEGSLRGLGRRRFKDGCLMQAFIYNMKTRESCGRLPPGRRAQLEGVGIAFTHEFDLRSENNVRAVEEFARDFGRLPKKREVRGTGEWLMKLKQKFVKAQDHRLSREQMDRLQALPGWDEYMLTRKERDERLWSSWFALLKEYVEEYGHPHVFAKEEYRGKKLGSWVADLRRKKLCDSQIRRLEALGFERNGFMAKRLRGELGREFTKKNEE